MVDDLRRQASEIYRERNKDGALRTSESLSLKKLTYIAIGLAVVVLIIIQLLGGFESRPDPVKAAATPAPLVKEAPPPELMDGTPDAKVPAALKSPEPKAETVAAKPAPAATKPKSTPKPAPPAPVVAKKTPPSKPKQVAAPAVTDEKTAPAPTETPEPEPEVDETPPEPEISEEEMARRELARELTIQKSSAMAELILLPGNQEWEASPEGADAYLVTFVINEDSQPVRYVWRVNLDTKSVAPLSYYARRLPKSE